MAGAADLVSGKRPAEGGAAPRRPGLRERVRDALAETVGGRLTRIFTLRLMLSIGVASLVSQALPLQRSYWVVLTVAIVLRPGFGSVFARALERGLGTVVGAVLGAVILMLPPGPLLLIPCAIFAGLLPYGRDQLGTVQHVPHAAGRHPDRPARPERLAAGPGPAHRHRAGVRDRAPGRLRSVAIELACSPAGTAGHRSR